MPYYSDDSPQTKAAKKAGENRRRRAEERRDRERRRAEAEAAGYPYGHVAEECGCNGCVAFRAARDQGET